MNKVAIAFSTKDRVELSRQSIEPLLQPGKFDLFWSDGSDTTEGKQFSLDCLGNYKLYGNVRGGADAAIVFNLTAMLDHPNNYTHVGLVENDVLLRKDWFAPTIALFERGKDEGLEVGAVSARCYEDRILCQRDGYALCHNLGAGMCIFTREAARLVLNNFRTTHTRENRSVFARLAGIDIGRYWAFRNGSHWLTADWGFDRILAEHGLASLALTPSPCQMIGQIPPLHEQGLKLVDEPVEALRNDRAFETFNTRTALIRDGQYSCARHDPFYQDDIGLTTIFPHQIEWINGVRVGNWSNRWVQGYGPFAYVSGEDAKPGIRLRLYGDAQILVSGGKAGGTVRIIDGERPVFEIELPPDSATSQVWNLPVQNAFVCRPVDIECLSPGLVFHGVTTNAPQLLHPQATFDHSVLPPV